MRARLLIFAIPPLLLAAACVGHPRPENAALRQPWPNEPAPALTAYSGKNEDYPSVGGDILKGASPADLEAARNSVEAAEPKD